MLPRNHSFSDAADQGLLAYANYAKQSGVLRSRLQRALAALPARRHEGRGRASRGCRWRSCRICHAGGDARSRGRRSQYGSSCIVPSCSRQPPLAPRRNLAVINKVYLAVGKDVGNSTQETTFTAEVDKLLCTPRPWRSSPGTVLTLICPTLLQVEVAPTNTAFRRVSLDLVQAASFASLPMLLLAPQKPVPYLLACGPACMAAGVSVGS